MSETRDVLYERVPGGFEPDTLLPSQYFDRVRGRAGRGGEWALMVAIVEDAVNMYLKHAAAKAPHNARLFEDAEQWIEERDSTWIFSFESICDMLGLDADHLRRGLRAAKAGARGRGAENPGSPIRIAVGEGGDDQLQRASGD
jgi:hypothetical protein